MTFNPSRLSHIEVADHPYDKGYWHRYAGGRRPARTGQRQRGWDSCDQELRAEAASQQVGTR